MKQQHLFVYGTLKRGEAMNILLPRHSANLLGQARLQGYALYDLGAFPAILPREGESVLGECYAINPSSLPGLDRYEGEGSLYLRRQVRVSLGGGTEKTAWTYVYNRDIPEARIISRENQPWRKTVPKPDDELWYACYGSNINYERFMLYIQGCDDKTPPKETRPYVLPHRLYFGGRSRTWAGPVAFISTLHDENARTLGRVYRITAAQFDQIRDKEGPSDHWYGNRMCLGQLDGLPVYTLTRMPEYEGYQPGVPSQDYVETIRGGFEQSWPGEDFDAYLSVRKQITA
ncbi:MAG: gamma-glutamylcyclotransferase [Eubacteriales bacterium]|nr:gamma-glutamylcyclotransferase [Eubacteriales bacterium]